MSAKTENCIACCIAYAGDELQALLESVEVGSDQSLRAGAAIGFLTAARKQIRDAALSAENWLPHTVCCSKMATFLKDRG